MPSRFLLNAAVAALILGTPLYAAAQDNTSDIRPNLGYYYWDVVSYQGEESYQLRGEHTPRTNPTGAIGPGPGERRPKIRLRGRRVSYMYDFCGKTNNLIGFALDRSRRTAAPLTGGAVEEGVNYETDAVTVFFGQHFSSGDFSDFYAIVGRIQAEGYFVDTFGNDFKDRSMLEIGFRSRVGERRNLELIQKTRFDDFYRLQFETGFMYHTAGGFSFGISYEIKDDIEYDDPTPGNTTTLQPTLQNQDSVSVTVRFNI